MFRSSKLYLAAEVGRPATKIDRELPGVRQQPVTRQLSTPDPPLPARRAVRPVLHPADHRVSAAIGHHSPRHPGQERAACDQPASRTKTLPTVLMVLILCACFMGMANSVREIVKERPIYRRERSIGLSLTAYLGSKVVVLALLHCPQALVFTLIGVLGRTPSKASCSARHCSRS